MKLHRQTIVALRDKARKMAKKALKEFKKYDNFDDMKELDAWNHAARWLSEELEQND